MTADVPKVSILILNWNNAADTLECLDSVSKIDYPRFATVVVDNGSRDDSPEVIRRQRPDVRMLRLRDNCGFARAKNIGIQELLAEGTDYCLLLNNDTVVDPAILRAFVDAAAAHPDAGFLGAKVYYFSTPDRIWAAITRWDERKARFEYVGNNETDDPARFGTVGETTYACGCALFFSASLIRRIGLMDERFYCYFEEVDWCFRAHENGLRNYFVPDARLWHKVSVAYGGKASPVVEYFRTRNALLWARKHLSPLQRARIFRRIGAAALAPFTPAALRRPDCSVPRALYWRLRSLATDPSLCAQWSGIRDYLLGRFGDCPPSIKDFLMHDRTVYERIRTQP